MFCGNKKHSRKFCPARNVMCFNCTKKVYFSKMRISTPSTSNIKNENNVNAMIMGIETESTKSQVL